MILCSISVVLLGDDDGSRSKTGGYKFVNFCIDTTRPLVLPLRDRNSFVTAAAAEVWIERQ